MCMKPVIGPVFLSQVVSADLDTSTQRACYSCSNDSNKSKLPNFNQTACFSLTVYKLKEEKPTKNFFFRIVTAMRYNTPSFIENVAVLSQKCINKIK